MRVSGHASVMHAFTNSAAAPARPADSDNLRSTLSSADLLAYAAVTVANNSTLVKVNETSNDNGSRTGSPLAALLPNPFFSWKLQLATDCDSETLPSGNSLYNTFGGKKEPFISIMIFIMMFLPTGWNNTTSGAGMPVPSAHAFVFAKQNTRYASG